MTRIGTNLVANYAGKAWAGLINLALVPVYLRYMGVEAYGLVGAFATLQSVFTILDMGLSTTANRELARRSAIAGHEQNMRDLVRTLEVIYWVTACVIGMSVFFSASWIAHHWLRPSSIAVGTIEKAISLMGMSLGFQWPVAFYTGGLMGLQRQVAYNWLNGALWSARGLGAVLVVTLSSRPVLDFFRWQVLMSAVSVVLMASLLWRSLPRSAGRSRFDRTVLSSVWRFAAGISAVSILLLLFSQVDKIVLSRKISLEAFGYYSVASQAAAVLYLFYYPIYAAFFPVLSQHVARGDQAGLRGAYRQASQLMSIAVLPVTVMLALFPSEVMLVWTRSSTTADATHTLVTVLMIGAAFGALVYLPFSIQQAFGNTKAALTVYVPGVLVAVPSIVIAASRFGAFGVAVVWTVINAIQSSIVAYLSHRRFLPGENGTWCVDSIGKPLGMALVIAGIGRLVISGSMPSSQLLVSLVGVSVLMWLAVAWTTPEGRRVMGLVFGARAR